MNSTDTDHLDALRRHNEQLETMENWKSTALFYYGSLENRRDEVSRLRLAITVAIGDIKSGCAHLALIHLEQTLKK